MARRNGTERERSFTMDLKSSDAVKVVSLGGRKGSDLSIDGTIGLLEKAEFVDNAVLEVAGAKGTLRIDLTAEDLARRFPKPQGDVET